MRERAKRAGWIAISPVNPEQGITTANEMHVPVGRTVQLSMTSADVIHSFWVPRVGGKRDVNPGETTGLWFTVDSAGRYPGQCAEFCGTSHALMQMELVAQDSAGFRQWVEDRVMPLIADAYIERRFPRELIPEMGELGMFGANLPEEYGCAGLNNVAYGLIMQELERGDSGIRSFASVQGALVMYPIFAFGSEEQKREWLPRLGGDGVARHADASPTVK